MIINYSLDLIYFHEGGYEEERGTLRNHNCNAKENVTLI